MTIVRCVFCVLVFYLEQLRGKSHKTIVAVFQMLRTLCVVLGGGLDQHMPSLIESSHRCLQDKNQAKGLLVYTFVFARYLV